MSSILRAAASPTRSDISDRFREHLEALRDGGHDLSPAAALALRTKLVAIGEGLLARALDGSLLAAGHGAAGLRDLNLADAAAHLGVSVSWLAHHRRRLHLGHLVAGKVRFSVAELDRYLAACRRR